MDRQSIHLWKHNEVTQHLFKILRESKELLENELLNLDPSVENFKSVYFKLQGRIDGIKLTLEAELEDGENV